MATITKKELIDRIADTTGHRRVQVKKVVQQFLDEIVAELGKGNRLEFRDFGVFESKLRKARRAQNPKTLQPVAVPEKRTVKFKVGRLMKQQLAELTGAHIDDEAGDVAAEDRGEGDGEAGVRGAGAHLPVDGVDAGGVHADEDLAGAGRGVGQVFDLQDGRTAVLVQDDGFHGSTSGEVRCDNRGGVSRIR